MKYKDAAQADIDAGIASTIGEQIPSIYISWGALIQAIIDFLLIALILFLIIKNYYPQCLIAQKKQKNAY